MTLPSYQSWYRDGTIAVVNGSATVTGTGTFWQFATNVRPGDLLTIDGTRVVEILSVQSDTQLTLRQPWPDASATGSSYAIIRNFSATPASDLVARQVEIVTQFTTYLNEHHAWYTTAAAPEGSPPAEVTFTNPDGVTTMTFRSMLQLFADVERLGLDIEADLEEANTLVAAAAAAAATFDGYNTTFQGYLASAEAARDAALTAETNAETALASVTTIAANVEDDANDAEAAMVAASNSATAAFDSASQAAVSAAAAATSASGASTARTAAETAQAAAETARAAAETAETNAETAATAAAASQSAAATSATNAATSASEASGSATAAAGSATSASGSATAAAGSATAAAGSASAAAGSASAAATSASDADAARIAAEAAAASADGSNVDITGGTIAGIAYLHLVGNGTDDIIRAIRNSSTRFVVRNGVNAVGINVADPQAPLHVGGAGRFDGDVTVTAVGPAITLSGATAASRRIDFATTGGIANIGLEASVGGSIIAGSAANAFAINTGNTSPIQFGVNSVLRGEFTTAGFNVNGAITAQRTTGNQAQFNGWSTVGGANIYNGEMLIGASPYGLRISADPAHGPGCRISNLFDNPSAFIEFSVRGLGTPAYPLTLSEGGAVIQGSLTMPGATGRLWLQRYSAHNDESDGAITLGGLGSGHQKLLIGVNNAGGYSFISSMTTGASWSGTLALQPMGGTTSIGGPLSVADALNTGGVLTVNSNVIYVGKGAAGYGGNVRVIDDGGNQRWLMGLFGSSGARDWNLYDLQSGRTPIVVSATTGNVMIGTVADVGAQLFVSKSGEAFRIGGTATYMAVTSAAGTAAGYVGQGSALVSGASDGNLAIRSEGALLFAAGGSGEVMRILGNGKVGFGGITAPSHRLETPTADVVSFGRNVFGVAHYHAVASPAYFVVYTKVPFGPGIDIPLKLNLRGFGYSSGASVDLEIETYIYANSFFNVGGATKFISKPSHRVPTRIRLGTWDDAGTNRVAIEIANDGVYWASYAIDAFRHGDGADTYVPTSLFAGWMTATGSFDTIGGFSNVTTVPQGGPFRVDASGNLAVFGPQLNTYAATNFELVNRSAGGFHFYTDFATRLPFIIEQQAPTNSLIVRAGGFVEAAAGYCYASELDKGSSQPSDTVNWPACHRQRILISQNTSLAFTPPGKPCSLILKVVTAASGGSTYTIAWPSSIKWAGGTAPEHRTGNNKTHIYSFYFDGANYYGSAMLDCA